MGVKIPHTPAMQRGTILENPVRKKVCAKLGRQCIKCGLMLSKNDVMLAGSPDGICDDSFVEIKCPMSAKTVKNYRCNGKPTYKFYVQMPLQML